MCFGGGRGGDDQLLLAHSPSCLFCSPMKCAVGFLRRGLSTDGRMKRSLRSSGNGSLMLAVDLGWCLGHRSLLIPAPSIVVVQCTGVKRYGGGGTRAGDGRLDDRVESYESPETSPEVPSDAERRAKSHLDYFMSR